MGNISSFTSRYLVRKTRRFNIENRSQKFLEKDKLPVAPKHPSTSELLESLTKDPKVREELMRKNTELDENLKQVYVKSLHKPYTNEDEKEKLGKSKLPQDRTTVPDLKYGHTQPIFIPKGKYSLSQVVDMLSEHLNDPMVNTPQVLAEKYSLDVKLIESIIKYFRPFRLESTETKESQKLLTNQKMSAFAQLEEQMSKQSIRRIANESSDTFEKYELQTKYEKSAGEMGMESRNTTPELNTGEIEPKKVKEKKSVLKLIEKRPTHVETEKDFGIDIDSVYKDVANRDRKKKKKENPT